MYVLITYYLTPTLDAKLPTMSKTIVGTIPTIVEVFTVHSQSTQRNTHKNSFHFVVVVVVAAIAAKLINILHKTTTKP
jgi:hypothetical protein